MIIHDVSLTVTPKTMTWEGTEQGFSMRWTAQMDPRGGGANLSVLTGGSHMGTHIDAPLHFVPGGLAVDALDVGALVGPAEVVRIYGRSPITAAELERANVPARTERILFQTDNTRFGRLHDGTFHKDYTGLTPSAAGWLVQHGVRLVGMDYLSAGPYGPANAETHKILLGAGVVVVEGLDLNKIEPGEYTLMALPPKFSGLEASPCRCLLIEGELR